MRPNVADRAAWCECQSVCRSVCHDREPCKNGLTDRDAGRVVDSGETKEPCIIRGKGAAHCKVKGLSAVSCAKTAEPIEIPFEVLVWTDVIAPRKHVLDGGTRWCHMANTIEPCMCGGDAALLSNYFDHLFFLSVDTNFHIVLHSGSFCKANSFIWMRLFNFLTGQLRFKCHLCCPVFAATSFD